MRLICATVFNRNQHRGRYGLDHFVGALRIAIEVRTSCAPRSDDRDLVISCCGLVENFADRIAFTHHDLGREAKVAQQLRFAFERSAERFLVFRFFGDAEKRGRGMTWSGD